MLLAQASCAEQERVSASGEAGQAAPPPAVAMAAPEMPVAPSAPRVGLLLPLSGSNAQLGQAMLNAAEMAIFDVAGEDFTLIVRDTETPAGAAEAARQVLQEGARLILGPVFGAQVRPVAALAAGAGVSVVSFSTDRTAAGNGAYVMGILPGLQVARVVAYAASRGLRRLGALAPATPYGETVVAALKDSAARAGARVILVEFYDAAAADLSAPVRRLSESIGAAGTADSSGAVATAFVPGRNGLAIDALLLPEGGERLRIVAPLLPFFDITPARLQMLGTALWDDPRLAIEPALAGGWFAAPPPEGWRAFAQRYNALYGEAPPRLASLAYDATTLAVALARAPEADMFSAAALTQPSGFAGVDGIFRLRPDGLVERGLAVLALERDGISVIDAAPSDFVALTY